MKLLKSEEGFTLVELMISVVILGIIVGAMSAAIIVGLKTSDGTTNRLAESHDAQDVAAFFVTDVQSAVTVTYKAMDTVSTVPAGCSPASSPLLVFSWTDPSAGAEMVSYYSATSGSEAQLVRQQCVGGSSSTVVVAHLLDSSTPQVACAPPTTPTSCTNPGLVSPAPRTVSLTLSAVGSDGTTYSYTLQGSRRTT